MDDTGCFVLGRPYGRRGVLSLFEGGGGGGVPKVFSRKDPIEDSPLHCGEIFTTGSPTWPGHSQIRDEDKIHYLL